MTRSRGLAPALLTATALLAACGGADAEGEGGGQTEDGALTVMAGFYPLEFALLQVAGERVEVVPVTASGVDPHDLELSPREVAELGEADLVVYAGGMQPALDEAVAQQAPDSSYDATEAADLTVTGAESAEGDDEHADEDAHGGDDDHAHEDAHDGDDEHAHQDEDHTDDDHAHQDEDDHAEQGHEDHGHGAEDPHFWLDPQRYGAVASALAEQLAALDPDHAEEYRENAEAMVAELETLDEEFARGLADCRSDTVVTSHAAFGYLTDRYGLRQVAITGLSPESEPSPARMAEISRAVEEHDVDTIYGEVLLGEDLARTVATETGAQVQLLDPLEGLTDASPGSDYFEVMRANLAALQEGQDCS